MKCPLQKNILWSNFPILKEGGKKLLECGKKLLWNNSWTIHAHVGPLHFQYVFWRLTLNLKPRSLVFYPIQGEKTLNIMFQLWWMILIRNHSKNTYHHILHQSNCMYNFFLSNSKKKLRFHFWSSHIPHLREFVQISVTNEISKNSNFTNSNAKSIRLRSKPFSIPRKHFIKKPWGNFHFSRFSIYHLISHMKTSVVRLSKNHRK